MDEVSIYRRMYFKSLNELALYNTTEYTIQLYFQNILKISSSNLKLIFEN